MESGDDATRRGRVNEAERGVERCPSCGQLEDGFVPAPGDFVDALPANGWLVHYWTSPNDSESVETRTEPLAVWGLTRRGEVFPLLKSESPDVTIEDAGDDFAFIARASAAHQELEEIRREAHAQRSNGSGR